MNEPVSVEFLLQIIGRLTVERDILQMRCDSLQKELGKKTDENEKTS